MARQKSKKAGLHDKTILYILQAIVLLVIIQNIKVFIGFASLLILAAAAFYGLRWYVK